MTSPPIEPSETSPEPEQQLAEAMAVPREEVGEGGSATGVRANCVSVVRSDRMRFVAGMAPVEDAPPSAPCESVAAPSRRLPDREE